MFLEVGIVQSHAIWPKVGTLAVDIVLVLLIEEKLVLRAVIAVVLVFVVGECRCSPWRADGGREGVVAI